MIRVSAIVSAYYSEKFFEDRLRNLMEQDEQPEIVVVCQEGSAEDRISAAYPVVRLLTPDIPVLSIAWNMAIQAAKGEYVTSANTDDLAYPGAFRLMADTLDQTGAALVFSDVDMRIGDQVVRWKRLAQYNRDLLMRRSIIGPMPMWRRSLHDKYGWFKDDLIVAQDWDFFLRVSSEPFVYLPKPLGVFWKRGDNIAGRHRKEASAEPGRVRSENRK